MKKRCLLQSGAGLALVAALMCVPAHAEDAKVIWTKTCAACHGKDGKGNTKMGRKVDVKDYTDAKVQAEIKDDQAMKSIKEGIKDDKGKERMKAYRDQLSDDEVKSLVAYIREFKGK